jgi:sporulation protein YabP
MSEEQFPHRLVLDQRKRLTMTGVGEVISFEEDGVVLKTTQGILQLQGRGLKLQTLVPDGGQLEITGLITGLCYQEPKAKGGWARRLLE